MEELEEFAHKHRSKAGRRHPRRMSDAAEDSSRNSALYSLTSENERDEASDTPSDESSGVVAVDTYDEMGRGQCDFRGFCFADDDSIQGSYGGLREGEILIAASTISTKYSDDGMSSSDHASNETSEQSRSQSVRIERMESRADSPSSMTTGRENETTKSEGPELEEESSWFWCWNLVLEDEDTDTTEGTDDFDSNETVESKSRIADTDTVIYHQRSEDNTGEDSTTESVTEERADAIAERARANNILDRFKRKEDRPVRQEETEEPQDETEHSQDETEEPQDETDQPQDVTEHPPEETEQPHKKNGDLCIAGTRHVKVDTSSLESNDKVHEPNLANLFVLGDNAFIAGVNEIEAGNGDTAFLIYLRATNKEVSEHGKAIIARRRFQGGLCRHLHGNKMMPPTAKGLPSYEVPIVVFQGSDVTVMENPRLFIEDKASAFLASVNRLSEASDHCLDKTSKKKASRVLKKHQNESNTDVELSESLSTQIASSSSADEITAQFMFCMRTSDLTDIQEESASEHIDDTCFHNKTQTVTADSVARPSEAVEVVKAASSIESSATERLEVDQFIESLESQHVVESRTEEETPARQWRGMSRSTVRAHALLQAGKNRHLSSKVSEVNKSGTTSKSRDQGSEANEPFAKNMGDQVRVLSGSTRKQTGSPSGPTSPQIHPILNAEDSTSTRLTIRSFDHRSSGEESLKGTKFLGENGKSSSSSNHSAGIQNYLLYLEDKDGSYDVNNHHQNPDEGCSDRARAPELRLIAKDGENNQDEQEIDQRNDSRVFEQEKGDQGREESRHFFHSNQ